MVVLLLLASIVMLMMLINRTGRLRVNRILIFTGDLGREIIESLYPSIEIPADSGPSEIDRIPSTQTLLHHGKPRILQAVDTHVLVRLASRAGSVIEMLAAVGDTVFDSTPILRVLGSDRPVPSDDLLDAIELGDERTFEQDPKYAIRLLVDIAIRALSPAINDPTTAVQALDQIEDLLLRLGSRRLEIGAFRDHEAKIRVVVPFPSWEDFLRLAFDEIRFYGATSVQVMRRMNALVNEMILVLPEERHAVLFRWQERLQLSIDNSFGDLQDRLDASREDRQGLGITGREQGER
jgi:uncharacterized membrane protein